MLKTLKRFLEMHGLSPVKFGTSMWYFLRYLREFRSFSRQTDNSFPLEFMPVLSDYRDSAGTMNGHYVHQDLWAATKIYEASPKRHVDIGSRIDGFITSLLSHRKVEVVDIRPLTSPYEHLVFVQDDATEMKTFKDDELESVSCLHAMEHFGLGRYGDPINPNSHKVFAAALTRVIKPNGTLYISVPIGVQRIQFNAHRIFNPYTIKDLFNHFDLVSFSAINDDGDFVKNANLDNFVNTHFACGLFEFKKKAHHVYS